METITEKTTTNHSLFNYYSNGILVIECRAISTQSELLFKPALEWCKNVNMHEVYLLVKLDYLSISMLRQMVNLLNTLMENNCIGEININWYNNDEDVYMYERGKLLEELFPVIKFLFFRI